MGSLSSFLAFSDEKKSIWYGLKKPSFEKNTTEFQNNIQEKYPILNQEQQEILSRALRTKDYFLLQGPPGTGKTSQMLKNMVDFLYKNTNQTIVLLAFTNRATDEICQKVEEVCQGNYLRLGTFDEDKEFFERSLFAEKDLNKLLTKIEKTKVFVSTVSSFFRYSHLIRQKNTLIVDEASQLLEPMLCGIAPLFDRFILVGDEKQLPAVVTQSSLYCDTDQEELHKINMPNLSISVFERLFRNAIKNDWKETHAMLSTQFRTHEDIANFISQHFYKTLKVGSQKQKEIWNFFDKNSDNLLEKQLYNAIEI
jgi:DNA replication ATP-dependent helicase Dna2